MNNNLSLELPISILDPADFLDIEAFKGMDVHQLLRSEFSIKELTKFSCLYRIADRVVFLADNANSQNTCELNEVKYHISEPSYCGVRDISIGTKHNLIEIPAGLREIDIIDTLGSFPYNKDWDNRLSLSKCKKFIAAFGPDNTND